MIKEKLLKILKAVFDWFFKKYMILNQAKGSYMCLGEN